MGTVLLCGWGECKADATVEFLWPGDGAEVWHVCSEHEEALAKPIEKQIGPEETARLIRWRRA